MKIGILTHHWLYNFGANLQALATVRFLESQGHTPIIINYRPSELVEKYKKLCSVEQAHVHQSYCEFYLPETIICKEIDDIKRVVKDINLNVVIAGSDAVLRLDHLASRKDLSFPNPFWLTWARDSGVDRIGFLAASSMGSNYLMLPLNIRKAIGTAIRELDYCSIRDSWTQFMLGYCTRSFSRIHFCPDPVLGFGEEAFSNINDGEAKNIAEKQKYILLSVYKNMLSYSWVKEFVRLAHKYDLKVFSLPMPEGHVDIPVDYAVPTPLNPFEWYNWIKYSSGYVGVRFHPIVCCLLHNISFVSFDTYERPISFMGKCLTGFPFNHLKRFSSKNFDICMRSSKKTYCLNKIKYKFATPDIIFNSIINQQNTRRDEKFKEMARKKFFNSISSIIG